MSEVQIFQILGLFYFAAGLGMLINPEFFKKMLVNLTECPFSVYLGGILALGVGYFLLGFHNVWKMDKTILITLIGWIAAIKGLFVLIFPKFFVNITNKMGERLLTFGGVISAILGAILISFGFFNL